MKRAKIEEAIDGVARNILDRRLFHGTQFSRKPIVPEKLGMQRLRPEGARAPIRGDGKSQFIERLETTTFDWQRLICCAGKGDSGCEDKKAVQAAA